MPGTFVFRPIEAKIGRGIGGTMNPYCAFSVGDSKIKGQVCKTGGNHPHWDDVITIPLENQSTAKVELMNKTKFADDEPLGSFLVDLKEIETQGQISKWYPVSCHGIPAGEILLKSFFQADALSSSAPITTVQEEKITLTQPAIIDKKAEVVTTTTKSTTVQPALIQKETITTTSTAQSSIATEEVTLNQVSGLHTDTQIFTEQRQVIEPHTFTKEVESVEIRSFMKEVEFMKPRKVMKEIEVTEPVTVTKMVEVIEPRVVKKLVEVMEPRVVIKEIKVIENVPVMKEVEVVEPKTVIKEIQTTELQTVVKQMEVIENFPVKKMVEVTEPVTITKGVEYVEPVITTTTIVKEVQQPVVVEEKVTTSVGPVSIIGVESATTEYKVVEKLDDVKLIKQEKIVEKKQL